MATGGPSALTPRETAVLAAVERRLGNADIADELHISVRTVESHIAALRRKLGADTRADLVRAAHRRRGTGVPLPHNSFVGRDADLAAVRAALAEHRWVTVVGPAGCGKTRLALETAAACADTGRVPVVVELEHATDADVVGTVAKAVGLGVDGVARLAEACGLALAAERYLLVLDNCDRVGAAVVRLVTDLLAAAPVLTVLATSRAPLGGTDECVRLLAPLPVRAGPGAAVPAAEQLLRDRAASAGGTWSAGDRDAVARICARLDGLPLAIELAAARARHLPLPDLAAQLEQGLAALHRSGADGRYRTLESAFAWTWDLLAPAERDLLGRLAALPRSFDLDLVAAVGGDRGGALLMDLLDRSLVAPGPRLPGPARFRLLGSLRAFVLDRTDPAVVQEVRRRHAEHHLALATTLRRHARTDDSRTAAAQARRLCAEVNAAVDWAMEQERHELALPLVRALSVGGEQYGPDVGSLATITRAAKHQAVVAAATPADLADLGLALTYSDLDLVAALADRALVLADASGDETDALHAHYLAGWADAHRGRCAPALAHLAEVERLAQRLGAHWHLASARQARGVALQGAREFPAATAAFEAAMQAYARAGDRMHVNNARYMMAAAAADCGRRTDEALGWIEECAAYARETGNLHELAHAALTRARLLEPTGRVDADEVAASVRTFRRVGDLRCLARGWLLLARTGPPRAAAGRWQQGLEVARQAGDRGAQEEALRGLVTAHWASGARRQAVVALGALTNVIGRAAALDGCPEELRALVDGEGTALVEGQAHWP